MKKIHHSIYISIFLFIQNSIASAQHREIVYSEPNDTLKNFYWIYRPIKEPKAVLILLPGYYQSPQQVDEETNIPGLAAEHGIAVVVPVFSEGLIAFSLNTIYQSDLASLIKKIDVQYKLQDKKLIIGGFSLGGSGAVKYTELSFKNQGWKKPHALFVIDSPLDMERFYMSAWYAQQKGLTNDENNYFLKRLDKEIGNTPSKNIQSYLNFSPYTYRDTTCQAIQSLKSIPIRFYTEPDINWQIENRSRSYYDLNSIDGAAFINDLQILGNRQATLLTTTEKGYRKTTHQRNPHSWSIVDPKELITWINSIIK